MSSYYIHNGKLYTSNEYTTEVGFDYTIEGNTVKFSNGSHTVASGKITPRLSDLPLKTAMSSMSDVTENLKMLANPAMISILLGALVGIFGLQLPGLVFKITTMGANCMTPCAMILMGFVLAKTSLKKTFLSPKMYLVSIIRLIILPLVFGAIAYFVCLALNLDMLYAFLVIAFCALPLGSNTAVFPESVGLDGTVGAQSSFISTILGLITIPVVFAILEGLNLFTA